MAERKGERTKASQARDREDAVRQEYRNAGMLDGFVEAWALARKVREHFESTLVPLPVKSDAQAFANAQLRQRVYGARIAELAIAREARRRFPKSATAALTARGWTPAGSADDKEPNDA